MEQDTENKLYQLLRNSGFLTKEQSQKIVDLIELYFKIEVK